VVDYYDASTMNRPYRQALPQEEVLRSLRREAGRRFDPNLVTAFLTCGSAMDRIRKEYPVA
jgi:putative two-component system response regulator